ncbi:MAG: tannase/feruloyl esterase family alpha/beta hydrolase [Hyphomicrobiales bacterium]|nr:tannase/feruloyl esterase family alpha/beta hydrolase [Hyphomicrobiales bacterium]MCP5370769.1 tannase/feruloyl esterase family alpha/beta hydrolase [Hyphomicrobiales bacterium]
MSASMPLRAAAARVLAGIAAAVAVLVALAATPATAETDLRARCSAMAAEAIEDVNLLSAVVVERKRGMKPYCRVLGYVRPAINFEIRLPIEGWNGKFYMAGCSGACGRVRADRRGPSNSTRDAQRRGYAVATTDSGHWGQHGGDGVWAYHNRRAEIDWAERAINQTTRTAKELLRRYYGRPQERAYFAGCSNGGRQGLIEAQRFANDFDGIIAGAPWLDLRSVNLFAWLYQKGTNGGGWPILERPKIDLLGRAVTAACDAKDGLEDGIVSDPEGCDFDPAALRCGGTKVNGDCLTDKEIAAVRAIYAGPRNSAGEPLYSGGLPKGSERNWPLFLSTGTTDTFEANVLRYLAFEDDPGGEYDPRAYDMDKDPERIKFMSRIVSADNPDLSAFRDHGGKMILYHGTADALLPYRRTVDYYDAAVAKAGGAGAADRFLRLYLVPGMSHCWGREDVGPVQADFLTALENWVEKGQPPADLTATEERNRGKGRDRSRPLCPYPLAARYDGSGDADAAASFACARR